MIWVGGIVGLVLAAACIYLYRAVRSAAKVICVHDKKISELEWGVFQVSCEKS